MKMNLSKVLKEKNRLVGKLAQKLAILQSEKGTSINTFLTEFPFVLV